MIINKAAHGGTVHVPHDQEIPFRHGAEIRVFCRAAHRFFPARQNGLRCCRGQGEAAR